MLQETHSAVFNKTDWRREFEGKVILRHFSRTSAGVALLFSRDFVPLSNVVEERVKGRLLVVKAKYECFNIVFINVYAPNSGPDRFQFLNELSLVLSQCVPEDYLFLAGDFNCTADDNDRSHTEPHAPSRKATLTLMENHSLSYVWRKIRHNVKQYT